MANAQNAEEPEKPEVNKDDGKDNDQKTKELVVKLIEEEKKNIMRLLNNL